MNIEKMREEFEAEMNDECISSGQKLPDLSLSPCVLDDGAVIYRDDLTQACWWSYRKGWKASRAAIEVELPDRHPLEMSINAMFGYQVARKEAAKAIESLGLKVKP